MNEKFVHHALAFGLTCSVAFICGYLFRANYGGDKQPISEAIIGAHTALELLDTYSGVVLSFDVYKDLSAITSMNDVQSLKAKYRDRTLSNLDYFEREANKPGSDRRKAILAPLMEQAKNFRGQLNNKP